MRHHNMAMPRACICIPLPENLAVIVMEMFSLLSFHSITTLFAYLADLAFLWCYLDILCGNSECKSLKLVEREWTDNRPNTVVQYKH